MFNTRIREMVPWTGSSDEVTAMTRSLPEYAVRELERVFTPGYAWFAEDNKQEALLYVQGWQVAYAQNLAQQTRLYQHQVIQIVQRDRAQQVVWLKVHYRRPIHWSTSYGYDTFTVEEHDAKPPCEWRYARIEQFGRLIPPQALLALSLVEQERVAPDSYWVADKYERSMVQRVADPILSAQFGPYFVALAEWV